MRMQLWAFLGVLVLAIVQVGCGGSGGSQNSADLAVKAGADLAVTPGADLAVKAGADLATSGGATASVAVGPGISFSPASVTIASGGKVTWTWSGALPHSVTSGTCAGTCTPDGKFASTTQTSGTFSFTFPTAGDFPYYCVVHGSMMTATVHVQ
jgi:plastocyanin